MFVLPSILQGKGVLYIVPGNKLKECLRASPAAEQRGADSCVTDILGACRTPGIIMGLIGRSVYGEMEMVNMHPDITVSVHGHATFRVMVQGQRTWRDDVSGALSYCVMSLLSYFFPI